MVLSGDKNKYPFENDFIWVFAIFVGTSRLLGWKKVKTNENIEKAKTFWHY